MLTLAINGEEMISTEDSTFEYGMTGYYQEEAGSFLSSELHIRTTRGRGIERIK